MRFLPRPMQRGCCSSGMGIAGSTCGGWSRKIRGVAESLVKSKRYLVPLVVLSPQVTGGALVAYLTGGRLNLPKDTEVFDLQDAVVESWEVEGVPGVVSAGSGGESGGN